MKYLEQTKQIREEAEQRKIETAALSLEHRFRAVFESAPDAIIIVNSKGLITYLNSQTEEMFGYEKSELQGRPIEILVPQNLRTRHVALRDAYFRGATGRPMGVARDLMGVRKDGTFVPVDISLSPGTGDPNPYVVTSIRDITQKKEIDAQMRAALAEKEVLLREIHHRVKNNLNVISSLLDLQLENISDPTLINAFRESQNRVISMALIHEKLYQSQDLSRIDFEEYVKDLIPTLFHSYGVDQTKVEVSMDIPHVDLGIDVAIPCSLIVNELVSNALKYAFKSVTKGEIGIGVHSNTTADPTEYELVVEDNGIGLPKGFDIDRAKSLGLRLVKTLTRQLGGRVRFTSDHGTKFSIRFSVPSRHEKEAPNVH